ncbi:hypothetical protein C2G38_2158150 [Gigaspora rosea]|uniref:Uncharacterized protein n=1 Tax=Gigaspora rosea TaxID=44941 RepID=A0A397W0U8_9GLOM|nr:hypothetical protein C2G38_2158150 [Gigaspora rosea]
MAMSRNSVIAIVSRLEMGRSAVPHHRSLTLVVPTRFLSSTRLKPATFSSNFDSQFLILTTVN